MYMFCMLTWFSINVVIVRTSRNVHSWKWVLFKLTCTTCVVDLHHVMYLTPFSILRLKVPFVNMPHTWFLLCKLLFNQTNWFMIVIIRYACDGSESHVIKYCPTTRVMWFTHVSGYSSCFICSASHLIASILNSPTYQYYRHLN